MKNTLILAFTLTAASAFAQTPAAPAAPSTQVDKRFAAWIGCWRLEDDLAGTGARLCITPEPIGVRMQTIAGTNKGIDEVVIPDGVAHPIADADCKGTATAAFSKDNQRVFRTAQVTCGKEAPRTVSSVAFLAGSSFINVQHVSGDRATAALRVERYRRSVNQKLADGSTAFQPPAAALAAVASADARWSIDDVIEASARIPAEAVQASLTELKSGFDLNRRNLLALSDGGVRPEVIDLMVALTYPKRFVIERRGAGGAMPTGITTGGGWLDPLMSPMFSPTYADCFSPYGYGYRTYYSMCGMFSPYAYDLYGYGYGYGGRYFYPYGGWIDVGGIPNVIGGGGGTPAEPPAEGRLVNGRGYTQIRNREPEPAAPRVSSGGNGTAAGWSGNNNGGGVSSSGYSSGGASSGSSGGSSGGDSGARIAVPKGPGGQ